MMGVVQFFSVMALFPKIALLMGIGFAVSIFSEVWIFLAYRRYQKQIAPITGIQTAGTILCSNGMPNMKMQVITGCMTDKYDPKKKQLFLSQGVAECTSIAAIAIAAHECGHAIQHHRHNLLFHFRRFMVPFVNLGSWMSLPIILIGAVFSKSKLLGLGIFLFGLATLFYLVTLPLEIDASRKGLRELVRCQIVEKDSRQYRQCRRMLTAAAFTYFAALTSSIISLIKVIALSGAGNDSV